MKQLGWSAGPNAAIAAAAPVTYAAALFGNEALPA